MAKDKNKTWDASKTEEAIQLVKRACLNMKLGFNVALMTNRLKVRVPNVGSS